MRAHRSSSSLIVGLPLDLARLNALARIAPLLGSSRDAALAVLFKAQDLTAQGRPAHTLFTRLVSLLAGSSLIGVAVALLVEADLGLAPYDVFAAGLGGRIGLSLGQAGWLVSGVLFLVAWCMGRKVDRWGVLYVFAGGAAVDAASGLLNAPGSLVGRVLFVAVAVLAMSAGISLVVESASTGGAFELIMLAVEDRGGRRIVARYVLDASVLVAGIAIGGPIGPATVFYGLAMGVTLSVVTQAIADHRRGRTTRLQAPVSADRQPVGV